MQDDQRISKPHLSRWKLLLAGVCEFVLLAGCTKDTSPEQFRLKPWDPAASARSAMQLLDRSGDNKIDAQEAVASPGLKETLAAADRDGNGALEQVELESKFLLYAHGAISPQPCRLNIRLNNQPLADAHILLVPEGYLSASMRTASGTTDSQGIAEMKIDDAEGVLLNRNGVQPGIYRIRVSKQQGDRESIVAIYNTETTLGLEVSPAPSSGRTQTTSRSIELKTK